jgi:hypothetical protein
MSDIETTATILPLKPTPGKSKSREPSAKRARGKRRGRQDLTAPAPLSQATAIGVGSPPSGRDTSPALAMTVFAIGLATAAVGLYLNASFLWKFGHSSEAGLVLAVVGLVTDTVTLVLPATVMVLWQQSRRALAVIGCVMYAIAVLMTLLTAIGFAATNIEDAIAGRGAATAQRTALIEEINYLKSERGRLMFMPTDQSAVVAAEVARDQECGRVGPNCRQRVAELSAVLRDKAAAERAAEIDARITQAETTLNSLPILAAADPQTEAARAAVAWLSRGNLTASAEDIRMTRVLGIAAVLFMAGLLLALGTALRQPART